IKRSRIDEILLKEGLRWRRHETWFGERVDPAFAEKRFLGRRVCGLGRVRVPALTPSEGRRMEISPSARSSCHRHTACHTVRGAGAQFLALPNGIPSHDTFRRVFMLIDPHAFECY